MVCVQEGLETYEIAIPACQMVYAANHSSILTLQRRAAAVCIQLKLNNKALTLLETVLQHSDRMQLSDIVSSVVAHSHLGNYDVALQLVDAAFSLLEDAQFDAGEGLQVDECAVMELYFERAHLMSLKNEWLKAKFELETCLKCSDMYFLLQPPEETATAAHTASSISVADVVPKVSPIVLRAAAALAAATAKCGGISAAEKLFRRAQSMALAAYGTLGIPTLDTQHMFVRFLLDTFGAASAQMIDAEAIMMRTVEAKRLLLGANHSSTMLSMQLLCHVLSQSIEHARYESALLEMLAVCVSALGLLHIDTLAVLLQLAALHDRRREVERAELLYCVGLCLLDAVTGEEAAVLASRAQQALLQLCTAAGQADKVAALQALMRQQAAHSAETTPIPFISRNFSVETLSSSLPPLFVMQLLHTCVCDLKPALTSSHPATPLVRLSEAILSRALGHIDRARALFSSCIGDMGSSWWHHPDCSFVVQSLAAVMLAAGDAEACSALFTQACESCSERDPPAAIDLMLSAADMFEDACKVELAVRFLLQAITLQSLHFGPVSSNTLSSRHVLADLHVSSGALHSAECVVWDALECCEAAFGQTHPLTIEWLEELTQLYVLQNNLPKAVFMANAAAHASAIVFGDSHGCTLTACERLARLLRASGQLLQSRDMLEKCLRLRIRVHGGDAAATNATRAALEEVQALVLPMIKEQETAAAAQQICDMEVRAAQLLQDDDVHGAVHALGVCFQIAEDAFGRDSTAAARAAASYGCALLKVPQFERAQEVLQAAAVVLQRELGWRSKESLVCVCALARACVGVGDVASAEVLLLDCLDRCEREIGLNDDLTMKIVLQLGKFYCLSDSKLHTARQLLQEYVAHVTHAQQQVQGTVADSREWELLDGLDELVKVLVKLQDVQAAEDMLQTAMKSRVQLHGSSHSSALEVMHRLANFYVSIQRPQQAVPHLHHVLDARSKTLGSAAHASLCAAEDLAAAYEALSQLDHAELLLSLCLMQRRVMHGATHPDCLAGLVRLALVLQKAGKFEAAVQCLLEYLDRNSSQAVVYGSAAYTAAESAGFCMMKMGQWERARIVFDCCVHALRTSNIAAEAAVKQHLCFCLNSLGIIAASEGDLEAAESSFESCLRVGAPAHVAASASDLECSDAALNLAVVCQRSGKFSKSEALLLKRLRALERGSNGRAAEALGTKRSLALLYRFTVCNLLGASVCVF